MFEHLNTPEEIFSFKLGSALKMEQELIDVLGELEENARRDEIKRALRHHREETRQHVANIEQCFKLLGEEVDDSPCPVISAMAKEGKATIKKTDDSLVDAIVLVAATESEHYEIAVYETLVTNAEARGATEVAALLRQNLEQEEHALEVARTTMTTIAGQGIAVGGLISMDSSHSADRSSVDVLDSMEQVLGETVASGHSRRSLMTKAAGLLVAGGALTLPGIAGAATTAADPILSVLTTFEHFGVTLLTNASKQAPGTPSAPFLNVLEAANLTEFFHLEALVKLGGKPLTTKFWIPDSVLDGGIGLFTAIGLQEAVEISGYLVGVTQAAKGRNAVQSRLFAEALGTECEHRVLARSAAAMLTGSVAPANNFGFEPFPHRNGRAALTASADLGIGYGKQGATPGNFYEYPGDPRKTDTAYAVSSTADLDPGRSAQSDDSSA